ncbi:DUF887-domain-containing protein [Epithele typhae]|uniref:DUF887-domain-containing protein n=1 Tax=Epithele typhae TaxID=378194 RepID=UPI0020075A99|nr:DUF887-domain-containing protein [Epithele typhae]KAH9928505.1 DUF887-domain-containing protein [Epithele typhae]
MPDLPFAPFLRELAQPVGNLLHLPHFPQHFPALVYAMLAFTALHLVISPFLSARIFPVSYGKLRTKRQINQWNIQVVSLLHVFIVLPLAVSCFSSETLKADKLWGWDDRVGTTVAVACGYFLWDALDAILNFDDLGFLVHGVSCFTLYMMTFRPFLGYFAPRFLSWELSTIFLNVHRFLDKTGHTGSTAQWLNGVVLLSTFFSVRIVYGWYLTAGFLHALFAARAELSPVYLVLFTAGNLTLNTLNAVWFYKMVFAVRKRFDKEAKPLRDSDAPNGTAAPTPAASNGSVH